MKTIINLSGNEEKFYRCSINAVTVNFNRGMFDVSFEMEECDDKIVRLWKRFAIPDAEVGIETI